MFNSYDMKTTNNLNINACSGGIYKTCKESWFVRFHLQSDYANKILVSKPIVKLGTYGTDTEVIVLQMIICGDMEVIAELIKKEDFNKYYENKEVENEKNIANN